MRKIACALLVVAAVTAGALSAQSAHAAPKAPGEHHAAAQAVAMRSQAMFNLTSATATALEAQQILSRATANLHISQKQKSKLLSQSGQLIKLARKMLADASVYQPVGADAQHEAARSLAVHAYRQALKAYRNARSAGT